MPLLKDRRILGKMDIQIDLYKPTTTVSSTGGPKTTYELSGTFWAARDYQSRKQMETEVATRITSFQQIRYIMRYTNTAWIAISKAGYLIEHGAGDDRKYNIVAVTRDTGRKQYIEIITELKE